MTVSWYSITITDIGTIFSGYFSVDNATNVIQSFYNSTDLTTNILLPIKSAVVAVVTRVSVYFNDLTP